jgi:hypothetical protein
MAVALQEQQYGMKWLSEDESFTLVMRIDTISREEHFQREYEHHAILLNTIQVAILDPA